MTRQSEAVLENNLIKQLVGLGYASAKIEATNKYRIQNLKNLPEINICTYRLRVFLLEMCVLRSFLLFCACFSCKLRLKLFNTYE